MSPLASRWRCLVAAGLLTVLVILPLQAQQIPPLLRDLEQPQDYAANTSHGAVLLGANMLLSGVTGAVLSWRNGGSFLEGLTKGAVGGAVIFAGKALVVSNGTAKPLLGRQLGALGSSAVRNAGAHQPLLSDVSLPFGPLHLHLSRGGPRPAWVSVDVLNVITTASVLMSYETRMDWAASLAAAAPVFTVSDPHDDLPWNGRQIAGLLMLRDASSSQRPMGRDGTLAHERVHLVEYDQLALLWSDPLERALLNQWRATRGLDRYLDFNVSASISAGLRLLPEHLNPVELEARFFADRALRRTDHRIIRAGSRSPSGL